MARFLFNCLHGLLGVMLVGWMLAFSFSPTAVSTTFAQEPSPEQLEEVTDDEVNAIGNQLFCPTCENTPVDVCPTQTCADWRADIRQQLAEGRSEQEILTYFADYYGPDVLANPPREGFGLVAWSIPVVVVLVSIVGFGWYFYHLHQAGQAVAQDKKLGENRAVSPPPASNDKYRDLLEQELNQKREP